MRNTTLALVLLMLCGRPEPARAQNAAVDLLLGGRKFKDGTSMFVAELRGTAAPRGWMIRPALGLARGSDLAVANQTEVMIGALGDLRISNGITIAAGGGVSHLVQDDRHGDRGDSTGPYVSGSVLLRPSFLRGRTVGVDVRYFAAPDLLRADGLGQEVAFIQTALVVRWDLRRE
jgi:hypothetical protein